jgi:flagellin-like protein
MKALRWTQRNRGVSPVIATVILAAVVIAIGGAVWSYAKGASTVIANDYVNGTLELINEVVERFTIEHVSHSSDGKTLYVWIYNYGDVDAVIDLYANSTNSFKSTLGTLVESKSIVQINISYESVPLVEGDSVAIKAHSRRQNNAYHSYYVS